MCENSYKFIVANSRRNTFTTNDYQWTENICWYHSIQLLNRSFHLGLVSEVCEMSYTFILATSHQTLSLKIFVEYHSIQILNGSFHLGLISEVCEISNKFILATSHQSKLLITEASWSVWISYKLILATSYRNIFTTNEYRWTENICWISKHSDVEQIFWSRASLRSVWSFMQIYSGNFSSNPFTTNE